MILGRTFHRILFNAVRRRERAERLAAAIARSAARAVRIGDRYANYASGREWALLGELGELSRQAETLRRLLPTWGRSRSGNRQSPALLSLRAAYDRVTDRAGADDLDTRLPRELQRIGRKLGRLEIALAPSTAPSTATVEASAKPDQPGIRWRAQPAAVTAAPSDSSGPRA